MSHSSQQFAVLHVALNPLTGAWSVMRELATAQKKSSRAAGVALGVITPSNWPEHSAQEVASRQLSLYRVNTPTMFGTASLLWQRLQRPPIEQWAADLAQHCGATHVVVHFHNAWMSGIFLPLRPVAGVRLIPISTFHGVNTVLYNQPVRHAIHRWMAQRLLYFTVMLTSVDSANPAVAEELFGLPQQRFTVIHNGLTASEHTSCPRLQMKGRAPLTIGHVGLLDESKGWQLVCEAVVQARALGHDVRLVLAGSGKDEPTACAFAEKHADWARFVGFVPEARDNLLPQLDLLALMSQREGLPMVILEAMSVGLPVAATAVGGISEAVRNGETGFLVDRTVSALTKVILDLCEHPQRLALLSQAAKARFAETFEIGRIVKQYDKFYEQVLTRNQT